MGGVWVLFILTQPTTGHTGDCNFDDENDDKGQCGWRTPTSRLNFRYDQLIRMWFRHDGSVSRGPYGDHTSLKGAFLRYNGSKGRDICPNDVCQDFKGVTLSRQLPLTTTAPVCMHFWYYLTGLNIISFTLFVFANNITQGVIFSTKATLSNRYRWLHHQVALNRQPIPFRVGFQAIHTYNSFIHDRESVALDDIQFVPGACTTCTNKKWGASCDKPCGACLKGVPCASDGMCPLCEPGYGQAQCNWCVPTAYKPQEDRKKCIPCGRCLDNALCVNGTGHCPNGCQPAWKPPLCQECAPGYKYAYDSNQKRVEKSICERCGHCYNNLPCYLLTADCPTVHWFGGKANCAPGYMPTLCTQKCTTGFYGIHCQKKCGQCLTGNDCNFENGACQECTTGYQPPLCQKTCQAGTYGDACRHQCGQCGGGRTCDFVSGRCQECVSGQKLPFCKDECEPGMHGVGCTLRCGKCFKGQVCSSETGVCTAGCQPGFYAPLCLKECDDGFYGDCAKECGRCLKDLPCNKSSGHCDGCSPGYPLPLCKDSNRDQDNSTDADPFSGSSLSSTGFAIGMSFIGMFLLLTIVTVAILVRRFRSNKKEKYDRQNVRIRLSVPEVPGLAPTSGLTAHGGTRPLEPSTFGSYYGSGARGYGSKSPYARSSVSDSEASESVESSYFESSERNSDPSVVSTTSESTFVSSAPSSTYDGARRFTT